MVPAFTAHAQSGAASPLRFGAIYLPNGMPMKDWMPTTQDDGTLEITPVLKPLEAFRDRITVFGNLTRAGGKTATDHAVSSAGWLSGVVAKQTEAQDISLGVTIDQVLAKHLGQDTPFPSLEFATEDFAGYIGGCVPGYSCTYMNTISWAGETSPLPMEINPRVAFERMFGRAGDPAARLTRMRENRSILDSIGDEARALQQRVSPADSVRLDAYLDNVREIERCIERTEARNATDVSLAAPIGVPEAFEEHAALMFELLAVAYEADLTRVFTYMMAREASGRTFPELGISEAHHDVSHHGNAPAKMALHAKINTHFTSLVANFIERLRTTREGDGSLLDHSVIAFGAGMSDGQAHSAYPLPIALVGGGGGRLLAGNRFVVAPEWTPIANLWLGVAGAFGRSLEQFGESTARLEV
jgi:hypothetical protein